MSALQLAFIFFLVSAPRASAALFAGRVIYAKDYGVVANGSTDDTTALQNATNEALIKGAALILPPGEIRITATWQINRPATTVNFRVEGSVNGAAGTIIKWDGATTGTAIKIQRAGRFAFKHIRLNNNVAIGTTTGILVTSDLVGSNTGPGIFENVTVYRFNKGMAIGESGGQAADSLTFINYEADSCAYGVYAQALNTLNLYFINLGFSGVGTGLYVDSTAAQQSIAVVGGSASSSTVTDFDFRGWGSYGIYSFRNDGGSNRFLKYASDARQLNVVVSSSMVFKGSSPDGILIEGLGGNGNLMILGSIVEGKIKPNIGANSFGSIVIKGSGIANTEPFDASASGTGLFYEVMQSYRINIGGKKNAYWDDEHGITISGARRPYSRFTASGVSSTSDYRFVSGISGTSTPAKNLRGSVTFANAGTIAVTFNTAEPNASYFIATSGSANEIFWVTAKTTAGFTLNSSNSNSKATVDWVLVR